jgi:hypothetical protein
MPPRDGHRRCRMTRRDGADGYLLATVASSFSSSSYSTRRRHLLAGLIGLHFGHGVDLLLERGGHRSERSQDLRRRGVATPEQGRRRPRATHRSAVGLAESGGGRCRPREMCQRWIEQCVAGRPPLSDDRARRQIEAQLDIIAGVEC